MNAELKKLVVTLTMTTLLLGLALAGVKSANSNGVGGKVDLFTQKEPYDGKGPNMPSDAFGPREEVQIYALATYNEEPVGNVPVAFEIWGPKNPIENITFQRGAFTNKTGIAMTSFRMPDSNETAFGEWTVIGNARICDLTFQDSVTFNVGWIVEIVSIKTMNESGVEQEKFTIESYVITELTLRNIAMTEKKATITLAIYDNLNTPVNSTELSNLTLQPNVTLVHAPLRIPENANLGQATVYACAYTTSVEFGGVPYCPEVYKHFLIINRDVAVLSVQSSPLVVYKGEIVYIDVTAGNKGTEFESFNVSIYFNGTFTGMMAVLNLQPSSNTTVRFSWNTSHVMEGSYLVSASAAQVPGEISVSDNTLNDSTVEVRPPITAPVGWFIPEWFYWLLLPLLILTIILLITWLYRRKRRKKAEASFRSGWTAWYYRYDLRRKTRKI